MKKIFYKVKNTTANTSYLELDQKDQNELMITILGLLTYMTEMSISKDKDIRDFTKWFTKPDNRYLYSKKLKRNNSPQSFLAGTINNIQFGTQNDFSLTQLQVIQDIINTCSLIINEIEADKGIVLQTNKMFEEIFIREDVWEIEQ